MVETAATILASSLGGGAQRSERMRLGPKRRYRS
jgi:hypothetical protein